MTAVRCPCGRDADYGSCCGAIHAGAAASTAEDLMRSRYSAYVVGDVAYLLHSWAPETRPPAIVLDPSQRWTGLSILETVDGGVLAADGIVEFVASFVAATGPGVRAERSRFRREAGRWVYVDGGETDRGS